MGFFSSLFGRRKPQSLDEWGLKQLAQLGDDLSKTHKLEFQLRFPTKSAAEQASPKVEAAGYEVVIAEDESMEWSFVAIKSMVPDAEALLRIHRELDAVASAVGGRYEGWGMAAEDQNV